MGAFVSALGTVFSSERFSIVGTNMGRTSKKTALRKCVCNVRACLHPYTVNFKCAFKYFPKIKRPRALYQVKGNAGLLPECSVGNRSRNGSSLTPMVPYFLFVTAPMDRPSTGDYSQTVQNYTHQVQRSLQVMVAHKRHS